MGKSNLKTLFDHFNKDGSGFMEYNEVYNMLQVLGGVDPSLQLDDESIHEWLRLADLNGDKKLSYYDFCTMLSKYYMPNDELRKNLRKQFYSYDYDNNGLMSRPEFQNYLKSVYHYMKDDRFVYKDSVADSFFSEIDSDNSGHISFDEYYLYTNGILRAS